MMIACFLELGSQSTNTSPKSAIRNSNMLKVAYGRKICRLLAKSRKECGPMKIRLVWPSLNSGRKTDVSEGLIPVHEKTPRKLIFDIPTDLKVADTQHRHSNTTCVGERNECNMIFIPKSSLQIDEVLLVVFCSCSFTQGSFALEFFTCCSHTATYKEQYIIFFSKLIYYRHL